jgi:hypothetical protein
MAQFHPERLPSWVQESIAEGSVRNNLKHLDDRWHILHHLTWRQVGPRGYELGEADFVLVHPEHGVLVLEVKGGEVAHRDGIWTTTPIGGTPQEIVDPLWQADRTVRWIKGQFISDGSLCRVPVRSGVVLPNVRVVGDLSANVPRAVVIDALDMAEIDSAVERLCKTRHMWVTLTDDEVARIANVLSPHVTTTLDLRLAAQGTTTQVIELSEAQTAILDLLDLQLRATIRGGSGTGKTVLAIEKARRLATRGDRVLLTCFNRMLADHLRTQVEDVPTIHVDNFHGLVWELMDRARLPRLDDPTQQWWDDVAPSKLPRAARKCQFQVDSIVIDEGQDFGSSWLAALEALVADPETAHVYRFEDPEQNIYERSADPTALERTFVVSRNVRCTKQIATRLDAIWGINGTVAGPDGPEPRLITVDDPDSLRQVVSNELHRLLSKGGLRPDQIAILSSGTAGVERLLGVGELLGHPLWRAAQGVADTRADERPVGALQVESVHRYKGLEADAVILLLDEVETLRERRIAYVGMGRARSVLTVIGPTQLTAALNWA